MDYLKIDFSQAYIRHSMFRTKLRGHLLSGRSDADQFTDASKCSLGEWLKEIVVKYKLRNESIMEVSYLHEASHSLAAKAIKFSSQNRVDEARQSMAEIEQMDQRLLDALNQLEREIAA